MLLVQRAMCDMSLDFERTLGHGPQTACILAADDNHGN